MIELSVTEDFSSLLSFKPSTTLQITLWPVMNITSTLKFFLTLWLIPPALFVPVATVKGELAT